MIKMDCQKGESWSQRDQMLGHPVLLPWFLFSTSLITSPSLGLGKPSTIRCRGSFNVSQYQRFSDQYQTESPVGDSDMQLPELHFRGEVSPWSKWSLEIHGFPKDVGGSGIHLRNVLQLPCHQAWHSPNVWHTHEYMSVGFLSPFSFVIIRV